MKYFMDGFAPKFSGIIMKTVMNVRCLMIGVVNALVFQDYQAQIILLIVIEVIPIIIILFMGRRQQCFELATYGASGILMGVLMILFNANLLVDDGLRSGI
jgi:ABC-type transport system involved in cytochrome bd biosynthesis fused ATPase/permease subunit